MFDILEADIIIMQELKIQRKDLHDDMVMVPGWDCYFSLPKHKKGYSGVGIYTRQSVCAPIRAEEGLLGVLSSPGSPTPYRELPDDACIGGYPSPSEVADIGVDPVYLDSEGRCLVLEFPAFVIFGVYSPANSNGQRDEFRIGFLRALDIRIRKLTKMGKYVILTGDLNVSREPIDSASAEEDLRVGSLEEYLSRPIRRIFNQLLENGNVVGERDEDREVPVLSDLCREFHPTRAGMYTHWEQKINARPGNFGSRIDFVLCSIPMRSWFSDANIQEGLMGSDHCPVYARMKDVVELRGEQVHILDIMNPPGMFRDGKRLRDFNPSKDLLPISGKLLPEFDKRRSIKDMFTKKPSTVAARASTEGKLMVLNNALPTDDKTEQAIPTTAHEAVAFLDNSATTPVSPLNSSQKRRNFTASPAKPSKRSKPTATSSNSKSNGKGQQSLKSFFTPKPAPNNANSTPEPASQSTINSSIQTIEETTTASPTLSNLSELEPFIDPEASKMSWTKLFSKKAPPLCEHGEPCTSYTTKKPGPNCGRMFWLCTRPVGPTGQKERGTEWRCPTFIWGSDWKSSG